MNEKDNNNRQQEPLRGFPITFEVYARNEQEVENLRMAIIGFIGYHRNQGRAVDAERLAQAISRWDKNAFVRNEIIKYFK